MERALRPFFDPEPMKRTMILIIIGKTKSTFFSNEMYEKRIFTQAVKERLCVIQTAFERS